MYDKRRAFYCFLFLYTTAAAAAAVYEEKKESGALEVHRQHPMAVRVCVGVKILFSNFIIIIINAACDGKERSTEKRERD